MEGGTLQVRSSVIRFKSGWKIELLTFHSLHEQFLNSFGSPPPPKYRMKLRIRFGNCSKLASKIVLRTTWLRIRKVREWFEVRETLASNIFFHSCSRAIFFITLFVMNYKVASLEIIRGSRDPVFFFIFLIRLISSKRTKWLFEWKDRNYFVSLVEFF